MKRERRKEKILSMLEHKERLTIQQMVEMTGSSEATVRRDIAQMEEEGLLKRDWGGVTRTATQETERRSNLRNHIVTGNHEIIGEIAARQIRDNELIFIGSGMTTLAMIPYIQNKNLHVITNGIPQMEALCQKGIPTLLLCGFFKEYSRSLVGKETVDMLRGYRFDRAFLGANGLDEQLNLLSADEYEDSIKLLSIKQSRRTYLLVEEKKFRRTAFYKIPGKTASEVILITNEKPFEHPNWKYMSPGYVGKIGELIKDD